MPAELARLATIDVGSIRLTYIPDGATKQRPATQFVNASADAWAQHSQFLDADGWLIMSFGSFLIESGKHKALVDLAWGRHSIDLAEISGGAIEGVAFGGDLLANLKKAGVEPADIDTVLYSHLHSDHTGWTVQEGNAVFPNAAHVVTTPEWNLWQANPDDMGGVAPAREQVAVIGEALRLVDDGDTPIPGVTVVATPGHTLGHASFAVTSGDMRALVVGDAVHCPIEFTDPRIAFIYDGDQDLARATKARIARDFSGPQTVIAGGHFPEPAFGRLDKPALPQDLQPVG